MQIVHRGYQENVHNCILQWNQLTLANKMTQDHCLAWQSLIVVQISLFGIHFTSLNMTNMRYVSRDLILKIGTLFWTVRGLPGTHCLLEKWSRKSPDLAWKVWILAFITAIGVSFLSPRHCCQKGLLAEQCLHLLHRHEVSIRTQFWSLDVPKLSCLW